MESAADTSCRRESGQSRIAGTGDKILDCTSFRHSARDDPEPRAARDRGDRGQKYRSHRFSMRRRRRRATISGPPKMVLSRRWNPSSRKNPRSMPSPQQRRLLVGRDAVFERRDGHQRPSLAYISAAWLHFSVLVFAPRRRKLFHRYRVEIEARRLVVGVPMSIEASTPRTSVPLPAAQCHEQHVRGNVEESEPDAPVGRCG